MDHLEGKIVLGVNVHNLRLNYGTVLFINYSSFVHTINMLLCINFRQLSNPQYNPYLIVYIGPPKAIHYTLYNFLGIYPHTTMGAAKTRYKMRFTHY